jgi:hypothetical protein
VRLDRLDVEGVLADLGAGHTIVLDSGARLDVTFRRDWLESDLRDARIEADRATIIVSDWQLAENALGKDAGLTVDGVRFTVRRVEPMTGGFNRVILNLQQP